MGRKSKYEEYCADHIEDIKKWVSAGATDEEVATALGIGVTTLYSYKTKYPKFADAFTRGRANVVIDIKAALLKKALGFEYEEEKRVGRKDKDGEQIILVEKYKRYSVPSETAANMLLRNYDKEWLDRDSVTTELKKQEMELKKAIAESNNFDLNMGEE